MMLAPVYIEKTVVVRGSKSRFSLFFTVFQCCYFFFLPVMPFNPQKNKKIKYIEYRRRIKPKNKYAYDSWKCNHHFSI